MPELVNNQHLQLFFNEYLLNSAGYVYHKSGALSRVITDADIPDYFWIRLNTTSLRVLIPSLYKKFPNLLVEVEVRTRTPPTVSLNTTGMALDLDFATELFVVFSNKTRYSVFTLGIDVASDVKVWVAEKKLLTGELSLVDFDFHVISSVIGDLPTAGLKMIVDALCKFGVVPLLNMVLQNGFNIPTFSGIEMLSPQLSHHQGFIAISTDIKYRP
ncbi:hypothetical protein GEMRC1_005376 [Eukaryota sp. GEM-RC1]